MYKLVLIRHGESTWNKENRFTGWTDVDLSEKGVAEAIEGGQVLRKEGFVFDLGYTSVLKRALKTYNLVTEELDQMWIPVRRSWRLNERHYGALQGLNKAETAARFGEDQVKIWRRSYDIPPPALTPDDERYPGRDPRYANVDPKDIPLTECLKDTVAALARRDRPGHPVRPARPHRRPRQQPARPGEIPRPRLRRRYHRAQHPYRDAARL